jgi:hypothetical protein
MEGVLVKHYTLNHPTIAANEVELERVLIAHGVEGYRKKKAALCKQKKKK